MNVKRTLINSCVLTLPWHLAHWISAAFTECLASLLRNMGIHEILEKYFYSKHSSQTCFNCDIQFEMAFRIKLFHSLVNYPCKRFIESWVFSQRHSILLRYEAALKSNLIPTSEGITFFLEPIGFWRQRHCIPSRRQDPFTL